MDKIGYKRLCAFVPQKTICMFESRQSSTLNVTVLPFWKYAFSRVGSNQWQDCRWERGRKQTKAGRCRLTGDRCPIKVKGGRSCTNSWQYFKNVHRFTTFQLITCENTMQRFPKLGSLRPSDHSEHRMECMWHPDVVKSVTQLWTGRFLDAIMFI